MVFSCAVFYMCIFYITNKKRYVHFPTFCIFFIYKKSTKSWKMHVTFLFILSSICFFFMCCFFISFLQQIYVFILCLYFMFIFYVYILCLYFMFIFYVYILWLYFMFFICVFFTSRIKNVTCIFQLFVYFLYIRKVQKVGKCT